MSRIVYRAGIALLLVALLRTAWVCDDAYITFRTVDNIVNGYGAVWNAGERVQAYTHPLWMAMVTVPYVVTREPYYTSMALSIALTLLTAVLLAKRLAPTPWTLLVCFVALLSSKAFVDFSTSGLENALTHALLALFVWRWWDAPSGEWRLRQLAFIASLCLLTRLDLVVLVGPAVAIETWRFGLARAVRPLMVGLLPILAWEAFSAFYYGSFVPNTAYAKVGAGLSRDVLLSRGQGYYLRTLWTDPATIPVMALGLAAGAANWPLAAGVVVNALYVLWIGGDFMAGRFFTAPFLLSVCLLARARWAAGRVSGAVLAGVVVLLGLLAPWEPAIVSGYGFSRVNNLLHGDGGVEPRDKSAYINAYGVMDERRWYYESSGLLKSRPGQPRPDNPMVFDGLELRKQGRQVVVRDGIGFTGYFTGPDVHIVDMFALSDPLLARLPANPNSRSGHLLRDIPAGYLETLESGTNRLADPDLAAYYDRLRLVISGPLWDVERISTTARLLFGRFDHLLAGAWSATESKR
jgi:arabinofuranosyltransferase